MSFDKLRDKMTWRRYKLSDERGIGLLSELIVYCVQRCRCHNCKGHFVEEKIVELMEHWPGTVLQAQDKAYLYRMIGTIMYDMEFQVGICMAPPFDIAMGAQYCINKVIQRYETALATAEKESVQCKPNLN